jgi:CsoR family transcriptional regulator, copper-sensing transcriptional repressor
MLIDKESTTKRLNRIEGQVRGIKKMIDEERYCIDILQQMQAIKSALSKVEDAILKDHASTCVAKAISTGNEKEQTKKFNELVDLIGKFKR